MRVDVAVVGGGPAGLAVALEAALRGITVAVFERGTLPRDKACGEGVMPGGLRVLERLGVARLIDPRDTAPLRGVRYVQEDGSSVAGRLPGAGGLGVRRTALAAAMVERARALGAMVYEGCEVKSHAIDPRSVTLETGRGRVEASLLVAADGLHSPLRRAEGLALEGRGVRRFGLRQHFKRAPWGDEVEVHLGDGLEAYVTPAGRDRVGVAFLFSGGSGAPSVERFLGAFPRLREALAGADPDSAPRGAGPFEQRVRARVKDRFVLVGDAAGYVDAVTGEGLSLALACTEALGRALPGVLAAGATAASLAPYEGACRASFARYALVARGVLWLSARPHLRRRVIGALARRPRAFASLLRLVA